MGDIVGALIGADATKDAASTAAGAQMESARLAADAAKFRPYSITSGFGSSFFDTDKQTAGYDLDPRLAAYRDQLYGLSEQGMAGINLDTQQAAQDFVDRQLGLLSGSRTAEDIALSQNQLASGRIGLGLSGAAMGAGAGTGYVNPEQYQRDLARAQVDAQLAADADKTVRQQLDQDIARATGLFNTGAGVEELGMKNLTIGADIGNKAAVAGANAGNSLLQGGLAAAQSNLAGGLAQANMYQNLGKSLNGMFSNQPTASPMSFGNFGSSLWSNNINAGSNARMLRQGTTPSNS